jgi:hypothetical protein
VGGGPGSSPGKRWAAIRSAFTEGAGRSALGVGEVAVETGQGGGEPSTARFAADQSARTRAATRARRCRARPRSGRGRPRAPRPSPALCTSRAGCGGQLLRVAVALTEAAAAANALINRLFSELPVARLVEWELTPAAVAGGLTARLGELAARPASPTRRATSPRSSSAEFGSGCWEVLATGVASRWPAGLAVDAHGFRLRQAVAQGACQVTAGSRKVSVEAAGSMCSFMPWGTVQMGSVCPKSTLVTTGRSSRPSSSRTTRRMASS